LRPRWFVVALAALVGGFLGGAIFAPQPAGAVSREIIQLQQQVSQLLQGQQDLRSDLDTNSATLRTLVQQALNSVNQLHSQMGSVQKTVQDVQANTGARIDTMAQQTQGLSDNLQDVQARVAKLSQQVSGLQSLLQSIDAKVSSGAPPSGAADAPNGGAPSAPNGGAPAQPPISANTLYQNALRDYTSGNYDLSRQEFSDYIKNFPQSDLASNAQFYLGEIAYTQGDFKGAIAAYDDVLTSYPKSFKLGACLLKKAMAELELGLRTSGLRDLREVVRRFPGTDEARRAEAELRQIESSAAPRSRARR
jgi:tol-pal system protein YbgF